jgi:hypothetical protein
MQHDVPAELDHDGVSVAREPYVKPDATTKPLEDVVRFGTLSGADADGSRGSLA